MKTKLPDWQAKYKTPLVVALLIVVLLALYLLAEAGYAYSWTGFGPYTPQQPPIEGYQREKTAWDWLQLLIIPVVLAVGGYFLNRTERINAEKAAEQRAKTEHEIAEQHTQDEVLEKCLDRMAELLIDRKLLNSKPGDEVREVARIRSLTSLRRLDGKRNQILTGFLPDAGLIDQHIIDMNGADLRGANLQEAILVSAKLEGANLQGAKLQGANLYAANLERANLQGADLQGANLQGAILNIATMPDGSVHE
jgi:Pentapeptide repeats (8 copies)